MGLRSEKRRHLDTVTNCRRLDRVNRRQGLHQSTVQLAVPVNVRTESGRKATHHRTHHTAHGLASLASLSDGVDDVVLVVRLRGHQGGVVAHISKIVPRRGAGKDLVRTNPQHRRPHGNAVTAQQLAAYRARRDPRSGLPRRRALEHIAHVGQLVGSGSAGVIGVPRTRPGDCSLCRSLRIHLPRIHHIGPVFPIEVGDLEHERTTQSAAVTQAAGHRDLVFFDALAPATTKTVLTAREPAVDIFTVELEPGRKTIEDRGQIRAVRFASRQEAEPFHHPPMR